MSTLVNDGLMRPIKEIQNATHFIKVKKQDLIDKGLMNVESDDSDEQDENAASSENRGYAYQPVCTNPKSQDYDPALIKSANIEEIDLISISEKRIFVRKAGVQDFRKSISNCKPTVNPCFLELYAKFLLKYGHSDQNEFAEQMMHI